MRHAYESITDDQIRTAERFNGWSSDYWTPAYGTPLGSPQWKWLEKPEHHAYHIRVLAGVMLAHLRWIGPPPKHNGVHHTDGSHRIRAVEFLRPLVTIEIPKQERDE